MQSQIFKHISFTYIGFALVIVGVPIGMYFNFLFPAIKWPPIFMTLSVLFIVSYKNLFLLEYLSLSKILISILLFQLLMLFYGAISDRMTGQLLSFHLYIICLIFALASRPYNINFNSIIYYTFVISGICSILGALFLWQGLVVGEKAYNLKQSIEDYALDPFTVGYGAATNLICALFCLDDKSTHKWLKLSLFFFLLLDIYICFASGKRNTIAYILAAVLLFLYKKSHKSKQHKTRVFKILTISLTIILILYFSFEPIKDTLNIFFLRFTGGVGNMLGVSNIEDESTLIRLEANLWFLSTLKNFSLSDYLVGKGYMTRWLDNNYFQIILDMGIIGFIYFFYLTVIYPLKFILKKDGDSYVSIMSLFCLGTILSSFNGGHPYMYHFYTPIILLAFASTTNKYDQMHINKQGGK